MGREDTLDYGVNCRASTFHSHCDSSWSNHPSSRSWFGYSIKWAGAAFCFRSKLEPVVALSSRDAEAIAAVFAVKCVIGWAIMMREFGVLPEETFEILVDNKATTD